MLACMSLVLITKECICVCLCKLGICTIFRLPDFKHDSGVVLLALIYVICCYGNRYSLASLPISFLARPVDGGVQLPTVIIKLELKLQHTGLY